MSEHPEIMEIDWIDDCFRVEQKKWKSWESFNKEGKGLVTGLDRNVVIRMTRFYLKGLQDGWDGIESTKHEGVVGGKL